MIENPELQLAYEYVQFTGEHVFLTGKAGTGKTTFLRSLKDRCSKRMIVVAPTGVAALNAGGVTIHSFFQMPFGPWVPETATGASQQGRNNPLARKFNKTKRSIIQTLDLLVIDEISMVRADLLDGIDSVLRQYKDRTRPFGGVQLLMIGDLQQLAPVIKAEDWAILRPYYDTGFFFGSQALQQAPFVTIELKHIFRQDDPHFIALLNQVRENRLDDAARAALNQRYQPEYQAEAHEGVVTLTTHNAQAQRINEARLTALSSRARTFEADTTGDFPEYLHPTAASLTLKIGAQVMFVKNDSAPEKRYFNGKIGTLTAFDEGEIKVQCEGSEDLIAVTPETWQNMKYTLDEQTKEITEEVIGSFTQMPLKAAWAITIHKSQGLTFDRAIIDAQAAFAHGQVYVALSRCRTLEGLVLSTPIRTRGLTTDAQVSTFSKAVEAHPPGPEALALARHAYEQSLLLELFDFEIFHRLLVRIIKRTKEHARALPENPQSWFMDLGRDTRELISGVGEKFQTQIRRLTDDPSVVVESHEMLQERVRKGCAYFIDKITTLLLEPLQAMVVASDNQKARKAVEEAMDQLIRQVQIKLACLKACAQKFSIQTYLAVRAKASVDLHATGHRRRARDKKPAVDVVHPDLYQRLKAWRQAKAHEQDVAPNTLITLKTMINVANGLPQSRMQLKQVRGIGKKTLANIGDELLAMVRDYAKSQKEADVEETEKSDTRQDIGDTRQVSLNLFLGGKKIADIAKHRGLLASTIETHLADLVKIGQLPLAEIMPLEKAQPAMEFFKAEQVLALSPAKEKFGDQYTYGELRMILYHLIYTGIVKG